IRHFIRFDNLVHHLKFLSMAIAGKPFMGIGRNMAYKKTIFFDSKGFSSILNIDGGEDDLFLNRVARKEKTGVVLSIDGMAETDIVDSFSTWRALKSKYVYTKQFYKGFSAHLFGWETTSKYAFYTLFSILLSWGIMSGDPFSAGVALLLFLTRFLVQLTTLNKNSRMLDEKTYHVNLLLFDLLQPINNQRFRRYANRRNIRDH
ncbi:MAG: glycosyl transferase family 2, partial [Proteiniphilum sp.]